MFGENNGVFSYLIYNRLIIQKHMKKGGCRHERYHQNKKMKPMEQNVRTPFGNLTNIQLSGTIDSFVIDECTHIRGTHKIMIFYVF
jgi:hypothetical protein